MARVLRSLQLQVVAAALLAGSSALEAFPFCFTEDGQSRQYSPYHALYPRSYPSWPASGYWFEDYPPVHYSRPWLDAQVMPVVEQVEQPISTPVAIPGQHIFR
jgi:hypothetical protein